MGYILSPKVSVILPVYNASQYLRAAIESVLGQTVTDFELLVIDDGSTDGSISILRDAADRDTRVSFRSRQNRGLVTTLNELIEWSRGEYLARMDADDICRPLRLEKQIGYLDEHPECVAVGSASLIIDPEGMPICEHQYELTHEEIDSAHTSEMVGSRICHPSVMMRREAIMQVGLYDEQYRYAEDLDLFLRLAEIGTLANLPEVLLSYRHHLSSVCYTYTSEQRTVARRAINAARTRRGIAMVSATCKADLESVTDADVHRKWAWWALSAGNLKTARKHALKALVADPFNIENLRASVCAIRGH